MKEIVLTQDKVALVDDEDFEWLTQWSWFARKCEKLFYAARQGKKANGKQILIQMHRVILQTPVGMETDHRDGNGLNNQKYNLRICTNQQNQGNQKSCLNCSSIYKGVSWHKQHKKWYAYIRIDSRRIHFGYFNSEIEAAQAYDKAAQQYFGEFARTNF